MKCENSTLRNNFGLKPKFFVCESALNRWELKLTKQGLKDSLKFPWRSTDYRAESIQKLFIGF